MPDNLDLQHLTSVYLALLISGGQVGLPVVVLTGLIYRKVTLHPTISNFCVTWIVYSIIHCLYLYTGAGKDTLRLKICIVQASMMYGAAPMAVVAGLAIVLHAWTASQYLEHTALCRVPRQLYLIVMLGTPYLVFFVFSVGAGTFVMSQPQSVCSNGLYCIIQLHRAALVAPSFCAAIMVIILALEAVITVQYYRQWKTIKAAFPLVTRTPSRSLCFRFGLCCLYSCVTLTSAILFLSDVQTEVTYMLPATLPLGALIVFGLRQDVITAWFSVLRGRQHSSSSSELELPSARVASISNPTLTLVELLEEIPGEPNIPV
ncbi:hypothetical protein L210DRAFT_3473465 [Boletus edulis BED1]|uniref:Uncharacterized protein n=1 Tax=Boletus edulis BED1 TaxID=1328754 RepID=A0AAD4GHJ1_BOLED|nr:hypothetical protein L210DRAFT_3473465 [Boletus edulis BED1]